MNGQPPNSTPFPYTTLFRSLVGGPHDVAVDTGLQPLQRCRIALARRGTAAGHVPGARGGFVAVNEQDTRHASSALHWKRTARSAEHTSELQSRQYLACRLLL